MNTSKIKYIAVVAVLVVAGFVAFSQWPSSSAKAQGEDAENTAASNEVASAGDAWQVRCDQGNNEEGKSEDSPENPPENPHCEIVQRLSVKESGQRLIEFAIGYTENKESARGVFILPTGILLEPGVKMVVDDNAPMNFKVRYCLPSGCFAFVNLNDDIMNLLRKGNALKVVLSKPDGGALEIPMSLGGFSGALDQLG